MPCKCGSHTHSRTTHLSCPLNKQSGRKRARETHHVDAVAAAAAAPVVADAVFIHQRGPGVHERRTVFSAFLKGKYNAPLVVPDGHRRVVLSLNCTSEAIDVGSVEFASDDDASTNGLGGSCLLYTSDAADE